MNQKDPARVLDEISDARVPQDLNLLPGILAKAQQGHDKTMNNAMRRRFFAALLLVLVLLVALLRLPGVVLALQKMIGYIPGVGAVDQSAPLRVLAGPVTGSRAGYTITVESALLDSTRTVLEYRIAGDFPTWADPTLQPRMCEEFPILRLPDGKELRYPSREGGPGEGYVSWRDVFAALPAGQNSAVLVFPCLAELPAGKGPQNWEIPIAFAPAPPEMTVYPVVAPPTLSPTRPPTGQPEGTVMPPTAGQPATAQTLVQEAAASEDWIELSLEGVATLEDGFYLQTRLHWQPDPGIYEVQLFQDAVHLFDAAGQEVPVWLADQLPPSAQAADQSLALNLQTGPILTPGPARLVVDSVQVGMPVSASFVIDLGADPQPGQTWELNRDLDINGYHLRVHSAEYGKPEPGEPPWLMLYLSSASGIQRVIAMDMQHEILGTGGSPAAAQVPFRAGWRYKDGFPQGEITANITWITVPRPGPWSLTWTPPVVTPAASTDVSAEGMPSDTTAALPAEKGICDAQITLATASTSRPAGQAGRITYSESSDNNMAMFILKLDSNERISLGAGLFPDLSPDGNGLVYRGLEEGLHIRGLASGADILIEGTLGKDIFDSWPKWSPDGRQIAFDRVKNHTTDVYVVNADGSDLHTLLDGPENENFLGWSPDGRSISYMVTTAENTSINVLDLQTGASREVARLDPGAVLIRLSPDGKRVLYHHDQGLFMGRLDGSAPVLLSGRSNDLSGPIWNPDGQWAAMMYFGVEENAKPHLVLLQPDTCQFVTLGEQGGLLSSWAP